MATQTMTKKLGKVVFKSSIKRTTQILRVVGTVVCILLSIAIMLIFFSLKKSDQQRDVQLLFMAFAGFFAVLGLAALYQFFTGRGQQVALCEHGLVLLKNNVPAQTILWDDIEGVIHPTIIIQYTYMGIPAGGTQLYIKLYQADKKVFKLSNDYQHAEKIIDAVVRKTKNVLLPKILKSVRNGETYKMGKVELSTAGIKSGRQQVNWQDVDKVEKQPFGWRFYLQNGRKTLIGCSTEHDRNTYLLPELISAMLPQSADYKQPPVWVNAAKNSF